jgi:hypothetical protein
LDVEKALDTARDACRDVHKFEKEFKKVTGKMECLSDKVEGFRFDWAGYRMHTKFLMILNRNEKTEKDSEGDRLYIGL